MHVKDGMLEMMSEDNRGYLVMVEFFSPVLVPMLSPLIELLFCTFGQVDG
jgi:hypothetical protein